VTESTSNIVSVSRRIDASPGAIFAILANPQRHIEFDGTEMLRGADGVPVVTAVGDVFLMNMYFERFGDYVMKNTVVEFEPDARIAWKPTRHDIEDNEEWHHIWRYILAPDGAGATVVTEEFDCSGSPESAQTTLSNGEHWRTGIKASLERLQGVVASSS
jgi:hypothetical protein